MGRKHEDVGGLPAVTSAATAVTPSAIASGAAQVGGRVLGLPRLAFAVAGVVVVAAAATAFALTRPDDGGTDTSDAAGRNSVQPVGETDAPTTTTAITTTPTPEPVAAFSGTYAVVVTLTGVNGEVYGEEDTTPTEATWTVTSACATGFCDVSISSSTGNQIAYTFAGDHWVREPSTGSAECVDVTTGQPNGESVETTFSGELAPVGPYDPAQTTAVTALAGENLEVIAAPGCGSGAVTWTYSVQATRTGD